jgi:deoxyribose-phosphate aldolase
MSIGTPYDDRAIALRALALTDLTELGDTADDASVERLCARAVGPYGHVAAVCVWPRHVALAARLLDGTGVRIATVVNFPSGDEALDVVVDMTDRALADGADEIDCVLPHRSFAAGDEDAATTLLDAVVARLGPEHRLKVILETGELDDADMIARATRLAMEHGADFVKTSTGKTAVSATPAAVASMLDVIRSSERPVGLKPSGGIRTIGDARDYLRLADDVMGPRWATPGTFRFGASGLLDALLAVLDEHPCTGSPQRDY